MAQFQMKNINVLYVKLHRYMGGGGGGVVQGLLYFYSSIIYKQM